MIKVAAKKILTVSIAVMIIIGMCTLSWSTLPLLIKLPLLLVTLTGLIYGSIFCCRKEHEGTLLDAQMSISRVNEELLRASAERDKTILKLVRNEKFLDSMLSGIPYSIFWENANGTIGGCNQTFAAFMGFKRPEDLINKTCRDIMPDKGFVDFLMQCRREIIKTAVPLINLQKTFDNYNGKNIAVVITVVPMRNANGKISSTMTIIRNSAKDETKNTGEHPEGIEDCNAISIMQEGVLTVDSKDLTTGCNSYFCKIINTDSQHIIGDFVYNSFYSQVNDQLKKILKKFATKSDHHPIDIAAVIEDRNYRIRVQPIYTSGNYDGAVLNVVDISELVAAIEKVEYAGHRKNKLLTEINHHIRTPINSIVGFAEILKQMPIAKGNAELVNGIYASAIELMEVINKTLDFSIITNSEANVKKSETNVSKLMNSVIDVVRLTAMNKRLEVKIELDDDLPTTINSDAEKLKQVLVYLCSNATKFTNQGEILLSASFVPATSDEDSDSHDYLSHDSICFSVKDTGCGIDRNKLQRIRNVLSAGSYGMGQHETDIGLGIFASVRLLSLMDCKLKVESTPLYGSTFSFAIPCSDNRKISKNASMPIAAQNDELLKDEQTDGPSHLLIVDDVHENRMIIEILLKKAEYLTTSCSNGKEAVELCQSTRFDVILMDIQMPIMNGLEATEIIKTKGKNQKTPIIAMTACTSDKDELQCLDAGCDDFIPKPLNRETLINKVWRYIAQNNQSRQAKTAKEITSFLADNPDYYKTIEMFVEGLPERVKEMQDSFEKGAIEDLAFKVHSLKGIGGFAGFSIYSEKAKELEETINNNQIDKVKKQLDELAEFCKKTKFTIHGKDSKST